MSLDPRKIWPLIVYVAVVAVGMIGILLSSSDGSAVPLWLGFCGVSGTGLLSQLKTQTDIAATKVQVAELANGAMELKIKRAIGVELAKYATNPKGYVDAVNLGERQRAVAERTG